MLAAPPVPEGFTNIIIIAVVVVLVLSFLAAAINILREYERGVVFQLGRFWKVKGAGPRHHHSHHSADGARRSAHHRP